MKVPENTPIVVAHTDWPLPKNIIHQIKEERMISALIEMAKPNSMKPEDCVGDAEVVGYLMPLTQATPISSEDTKIYLYCASRVMKRKGIEVSSDIDVKELSEYQKDRLRQLKLFIYQSRGGKERNPCINAMKEVFGGIRLSHRREKEAKP